MGLEAGVACRCNSAHLQLRHWPLTAPMGLGPATLATYPYYPSQARRTTRLCLLPPSIPPFLDKHHSSCETWERTDGLREKETERWGGTEEREREGRGKEKTMGPAPQTRWPLVLNQLRDSVAVLGSSTGCPSVGGLLLALPTVSTW